MKANQLTALLFFAFCSVNAFCQAPNWIWAKRAGGIELDQPNSITTDALGNAIVVGYFYSSTIIFGSTTLTNNGTSSPDMYIAKYDPSGNIIWAKGAGGSGSDEAISVTTDAAGNIYVGGWFSSSSITFGSSTLTNVGSSTTDPFIVKYDANGNVLWAKSAGGNWNDYTMSVKTDPTGNIYLTGSFNSASIIFGSTTLSNANSTTIVANATQDIFLAKYDPNGNVLWAKSAGAYDGDSPKSITTDGNGNVYMTGYFSSFNILFGSSTLTNGGGTNKKPDVFVVKYDMNGNAQWAKSAGGTSNDMGISITADATGNTYLTGFFISSSITFGSTVLTNTLGGSHTWKFRPKSPHLTA